MKKLIAAVLVLAAAAGGFLYYALHNTLLKTPGEASQVNAQPESSQSDAAQPGGQTSSNQMQDQQGQSEKAKPSVGVMKPLKTPADVLDAIGYEITQNSDTVGWLYIPDTTINNSVVQSHNNTVYLRQTERKQPDIYGCYYADYTCNFGPREKLSANTVVYGHSDLKDNPDGLRFSQLFKFTDADFAKKHPVIYFSTPEEYMEWQIFAVYYTDTGLDYISTDLDGPSRAALAQQAKDRSIYQYDVAVGESDQFLTLSTCSIKYGAQEKDQRFVIMAKLLPAGEIPKTVSLTVNQNPVQPKFG